MSGLYDTGRKFVKRFQYLIVSIEQVLRQGGYGDRTKNERVRMMQRVSVFLLTIGLLSGLVLTGCPTPEPELNVSVSTLHFGTQENPSMPGEQIYEVEKTFTVNNTGCEGTTLVATVEADKPWITVTPPTISITAPGTPVVVTVTIDRNYSNLAKTVPAYAQGIVTVKDSVSEKKVTITTAPDYYTQAFTGSVDLLGKSMKFQPNGGLSYYGLALADIVPDPDPVDPGNGFPSDPTGGLLLNFSDYVDPIWAAPLGNKQVPFYGVNYDTLYISSQGWVSFGAPGNTPDSLSGHFAVPQISAFPVDATQPGSMVSFKQDAEKVIITYENAPTAGVKALSPNDFQIELFFNGEIQVSYLDIDPAVTGVIGLSLGVPGGQPQDFLPSDLNTEPLKSAL